MTDLAPFGTADASALAGGIRWHVVVKHEALGVFPLQSIDDLLIACRAERSNGQRLGLASREQRGTVRSRQDTRADGNRTSRARIAAVDARLAVENAAADDLGFEITEDGAGKIVICRLGSISNNLLEHLVTQCTQLLGPLLFLTRSIGFLQAGFRNLRHAVDQALVLVGRHPVPQRLSGLIRELVD